MVEETEMEEAIVFFIFIVGGISIGVRASRAPLLALSMIPQNFSYSFCFNNLVE